MKRDSYRYRKIYEQNYGPIPVDTEGRTYEIHHKDGNRNNNDPENLIALSIQDHYNTHYKQHDWEECFAIAIRMETDYQTLCDLAKKRFESGNHPFLREDVVENRKKSLDTMYQSGTHPFCGGDLQRKHANKRLENKTHNFLSYDRKWFSENGVKSYEKAMESQKHHSIREHTCPHCGKIGKGNGFVGHHIRKCKGKK